VFWTITHGPAGPTDRGYAASREQALADFKRARLSPLPRALGNMRANGVLTALQTC